MLSNNDNNNFNYYDQYNSLCVLCNNNLKQVDFDKLMRKNRK